MTSQLWWYIARSAGIITLVLSGLAVIWGLLLSTRVLEGRPSPRWLLDLHRWLGGITVAFTLVHIGGLMADSYVQFSLADVLVPGSAAWRTWAVAWGVVAFWLLLAVQLTSLTMHHLPRRAWKLIHLSSYLVFFAGVIHGATAGTDSGNPFYVYGITWLILVVTGLTTLRVLTVRRRATRALTAA